MVFSVGVIIMITAIIICILSPYTFAADTPHGSTQRNPLRRSRSQLSTSEASTSQASTSQASSSQTLPPLVQTGYYPGVVNRNCLYWINEQGFNDDIDNNLAIVACTGSFRFLNHKSLWVVGYMYGLKQPHTNYFNLTEFTPKKFCDRHVPDTALYPFMPLESAVFTCQGWINLYGNDHTNTVSHIARWAINRHAPSDNYISIWARGYFRFLSSAIYRREITSAHYCSQMGQDVAIDLPAEYPFMTIDGSEMSCANNLDFAHFWDVIRSKENSLKRLPFMSHASSKNCKEWIELVGYINNPADNLQKIGNQNIDFDDFLPFFAEKYVVHLRLLIQSGSDIPSPDKFCLDSGYFSTDFFRYDGTPSQPLRRRTRGRHS